METSKINCFRGFLFLGEFGINLNYTIDVIKTNDTIATYASMALPNRVIPFYGMMFIDNTGRFVLVYAMPDVAKLNAINDITVSLKEEKNET